MLLVQSCNKVNPFIFDVTNIRVYPNSLNFNCKTSVYLEFIVKRYNPTQAFSYFQTNTVI